MYLKEIPGIGLKTIEKLHKKEIASTEDLIWYLPISYQMYTPNKFIDKEKTVLKGMVCSKISDYTARKNLLITNFQVSFQGNQIKVVAFNQRHLKFSLNVGDEIEITGKWNEKYNQLTANKIDKITNAKVVDDSQKIVPIYSKISYLSNPQIQKLVLKTLDQLIENDDDLLYNNLLMLHNPDTLDNIGKATKFLKFYEFKMYLEKMEKLKISKTITDEYNHLTIDRDEVEKFINLLPFELTNDQIIVINNLLNQLEKAQKMQTLVLGDVGSGKTIVALATALSIIKVDGQVTIMAPTEILARQIYLNAKYYMSDLNIALLTGSVKKRDKNKIKDNISVGLTKLVIGTHALIEDDVLFKDLKFVIIDEQHRFGVQQRQRLIDKSSTGQYMYLCATPIPRTYAQTFFNVLEIEKITTKPKQRKEVISEIIQTKDQKKNVYEKMESEINKGNQIFIVVPLIEEVEMIRYENIEDVMSKMIKKYPNYKIGTLHGSMKAPDKEIIMEKFRAKEYDILIATTVIEVGVDIPDATVMIILNSERYGLSQLHQLRGRVGRSDKISYCYLFLTSKNSETLKRLKNIETITDGEKLAEIDLKTRGSGDFFGDRQSGSPDFKLFNYYEDIEIMNEVLENKKNTLE